MMEMNALDHICLFVLKIEKKTGRFSQAWDGPVRSETDRSKTQKWEGVSQKREKSVRTGWDKSDLREITKKWEGVSQNWEGSVRTGRYKSELGGIGQNWKG
jgi:hypothetical protein